jgi:hypothetical protein
MDNGNKRQAVEAQAALASKLVEHVGMGVGFRSAVAL